MSNPSAAAAAVAHPVRPAETHETCALPCAPPDDERNPSTTVSDLIRAVGDANVEFENLNDVTTNLQATTGGVRVTFGTHAISVTDFVSAAFSKKMGLVIWPPRDKVDAAMSQTKVKG
jgi:hypothetical protein